MIIRLILIALFTGMAIFLTAIQDGTGQILLALLSVFGLISILETFRTFKGLELKANVLTIRQSFSRTLSLDLSKVSCWTEQSFHIRGQLKRSLILFFPNHQKITISLFDDVKEFERLNHYLKTNLSERRS